MMPGTISFDTYGVRIYIFKEIKMKIIVAGEKKEYDEGTSLRHVVNLQI